MKPTLLIQMLVTGLLVSGTAFADEEQDLIAVLRSGAGAPQKWAACQRLKTIGTSKAVPALAGLLNQDGLSQAARHVLESLPYPEVDAALRDALGQTSGLLKAGVIDSLGWRGRAESVPLLGPLLLDPDVNVARAAAGSLGRIGGEPAVLALSGARERVVEPVRLVLLRNLLRATEGLTSGNDKANAMEIYRALIAPTYPVQIRVAAWRDSALVQDSTSRAQLVLAALTGTDRPIHQAALKFLRESQDRPLVEACAAQWNVLTPDSQLAVLDAQINSGEGLALARTATKSPDLRLRVAGWQALGVLNDSDSIASLSGAATQGAPEERAAARESLERLRGPAAGPALLAEVQDAPAPQKAELLRVLGERGDPAATTVLLENARSNQSPVRQAALEALTTLAPPAAAVPLLEMATKAGSDQERGPILTALYAACNASPDREQTSQSMVDRLNQLPAAERGPLLPLLTQLGTAGALSAGLAACRDTDLELAKEGVRALAEWPNSSPAAPLLELARSSNDPTLQTLAVRAAIQVSGQEPDPAKRLELLEQDLANARRPEEKKLALGQLGQVPTPAALQLALKQLSDPQLSDEASLAALGIAEKLAAAQPELADEAAGRVLARVHEGEVARRAWALRRKGKAMAPFIRNWVACGPYRQAGVTGAMAVFNIAFEPERPGARIEWKPVPAADHINLGALFPGEDNCAAYLRTGIVAGEDCQGLLLLGSDDGVKAWLNGQVVHSNNVDRGEVADQDVVPIHLNKGANELLLKITQGGGGWSACARVVGTDFHPMRGVHIDCPTAGPSTSQTASKPGP